MIRQYLAYLMITLIALQSVVAMADMHESYQLGTEHLAYEHEYGLTDAESVIDAGEELLTSAQLDCHYCHCHASCFLVLNSTPSGLGSALMKNQLPDYHLGYFSYRESPDNPPPIS